MEHKFDLADYIGERIEKIVKNSLKSVFKNPKESAFIVKYLSSTKDAEKKRERLEKQGEVIPPLLMISMDAEKKVSERRYKELFEEAKTLGIPCVMLLGANPLSHKEVIKQAATMKEMLFFIVSRAASVDGEYMTLFEENRNLAPILRLEETGGKVSANVQKVIDEFTNRGILFGCTILITKENVASIVSVDSVKTLYKQGARIILLVEGTGEQTERSLTKLQTENLRKQFDEILFLSFPSDKAYASGCLEAGKDYFHIDSNGGAEPYPYSSYQTVSVIEKGLRDALNTPRFRQNGSHKNEGILFDKVIEKKGLLGL